MRFLTANDAAKRLKHDKIKINVHHVIGAILFGALPADRASTYSYLIKEEDLKEMALKNNISFIENIENAIM